MVRIYSVRVEVEDHSESSGEDIEGLLERFVTEELPEHFPEDLSARFIEIIEET